MMNQELLAKLRDYHQEELADVDKYRQMSCALKMEHPKIAGILMDIAHEECSHAMLIEHILEKLS